jgi:hypothetical protein
MNYLIHRQLMKSVFEELKYVKCDYCDNYIIRIDAIYKQILFSNCYYCSEYCCYKDELEVRKTYKKNI